jgi:hypothetical protein
MYMPAVSYLVKVIVVIEGVIIVKNNKYYFQKLTPISNVELKIYDDALNFVFANDDIKNVAVSGSYSAGKSSVIETYRNTHTDIRFLHISLAHFETAEGEISDNNVSGRVVETGLEGKILNQLIHQIDPDKIPQTNFKVKQKVSDENIIRSTLSIITFLILTVYISNFNNWSQFVSELSVEWLKSLLLWTTNSALLLFSGIICAFILRLMIYTVIKTQKNKNIFRKISLQGNEIEIFEENDDSYFDKYLNEVLYIFENSDADVIVFEDMDRYNVNQIFEKLREINALVNYKKKREKKPPIRFLYLLRDDIFISKDRTKFFDFIIPIVPVIDGSNSYDQFIDHFKKGDIFELFDENFLQGLSLYVDDMRILKNIYNEFIIYRNRIESTELDSNKLLAIITYKNVFPKDFAELQIGMGFVHTLFESKLDFINREIEKIEMKIQKTEENIQLSNNEMLTSVDELDAIFLLSNFRIYTIAGKDISEFKTHTQLVKAMKDNPNNIQYYGYNYNVERIDMTSEFQNLLQNPEYINRKLVIERKTGNHIETLKADIQKLQYQKTIVQNSRLREIIKKKNIDTVFSVNFTNEIGEENTFAEIKGSPYFELIKYLLRNGFIDETYPDYMTYFYENSLSRIDKMFLRSVTDEKSKEYSYSLKNPQLVLSRLRDVDFSHEEILNFDLLCHILKTQQINYKHLKCLIQQLIENKDYKFIGEFLETQRETNLFVEAINNMWPSIFECILNESGFSEAQKKQYAIYTLYYSSPEDIEALNKNDDLSTFISDNPTFLDIDTPNIDKIIFGLIFSGVKFSWIDYDVSNKELFTEVYKSNLYEITFEFISLILEKVYGLEKSSNFNSKNYTLVTYKPEEMLVKFVNKNININQYINTIIHNCNEYINDDELVVQEILNNSEITIDHRKEYISFLKTVIERIETVIDKELWSILLQRKLVNYSENNILNYFFLSENGLDSFLVKFINEFNYNLEFNKNFIDSKFHENSASSFFDAIVSCKELINERYEAFLKVLNMCYESFSETGIAEDKVLILIKLSIIGMSGSVLVFMREYYPEQLMLFITHNIEEYTNDVISEENFVLSEVVLVLEENVDDEYKIKLLKFTTGELSLKEKRYSDAVKLHIIYHNLNGKDIPFLLNCYTKESISVKEAIKDIATEYITDIVDEQYLVPFELLSQLFASSKLASEIKKELFAICLPGMNEVQAKEYLSILQINDFLSLFNRKRPKFKINIINEKILTIFKNKRWITAFDIDKDQPDYYRANGRKVKQDLSIELL